MSDKDSLLLPQPRKSGLQRTVYHRAALRRCCLGRMLSTLRKSAGLRTPPGLDDISVSYNMGTLVSLQLFEKLADPGPVLDQKQGDNTLPSLRASLHTGAGCRTARCKADRQCGGNEGAKPEGRHLSDYEAAAY